jgi:hypothetical protein
VAFREYPADVDKRLLAIYLRDHLAGASAASALAKRAAGNNRDSELGESLARLADEFEQDRETLKRLMGEFGIARNPVKEAAALAAERAGRFKLNGSLTGYSPLSRLVELEGLQLGLAAKIDLWQGLEQALGRRTDGFDFKALIKRAEAQARELEPHRISAARQALAS